MKLANAAAVGLLGATLIAAPLASAKAHGFCGPFFPVCIAGAVVGAAATVATLPLAVAGAAIGPGYYAPPAYYPAAPAYYPTGPAYYPAAPAYYAPGYYRGPVGVYGAGWGPGWHRAHYFGRPHARYHHY